MDQLIKLVNRLQDAFATVNLSNPIDLPQIVVIGSQSSGKSSVLENIVMRDFLPRGQGIVTRRPLVLQLINRPSRRTSMASEAGSPKEGEEQVEAADNEDNEDEWGEFLHLPGKKFHNFDEIRQEIIAETDRKTGGTKGVSPEPINLRVYSPKVLTLTLVDLPGLTKVPVGDQPKDIEFQIRDMILKFISRPNTIILAVTSANTDLANSDGLKLAREVDPEGMRTIGVLTKVDLMDKGTDVIDILAGRIIPLRLGYVPVVNRGQKDIDGRKSIASALAAEKAFFENHQAYGSKSGFCGTPYLARKLHILLLNQIRNCLPDLKKKISEDTRKFTAELAALGDFHQGNLQNVVLSIITEFCSDFRNILDGYSQDLSTTELNGGARISFVFFEIFSTAINTMDAFDQIKEVDIRTLLYNSSGSTPALFVATQAFEVLIKQQIRRLEEPCLKCVTMVFDELARILSQILHKPVFKRYPKLKERFYAAVIAFFRKGMDPTSKLVTQLVSAECCYVNTAHPDFIGGHRALGLVTEKLALKNAPADDRAKDKAPLDKYDPKRTTVVPTSGSGNQYSLDSPSQANEGIFGSFFGGAKKTTRRPGVLEAPPPVLKASGSVSEREFVEIEVIKMLIQSYFSIVKRTMSDMVPKCIMLNLVFYAREEMQRGLLAEFYREDLLAELLEESAETVQRRKDCKKMIEALQKADEIFNGI